MLQLASSQGPLQSLFCSCPNTLSALTETETPLTKNSNALAENSTALPGSSSGRTAWWGEAGAVQAEQQGEEGSGASSKQVLEGGSSEEGGERLK